MQGGPHRYHCESFRIRLHTAPQRWKDGNASVNSGVVFKAADSFEAQTGSGANNWKKYFASYERWDHTPSLEIRYRELITIDSNSVVLNEGYTYTVTATTAYENANIVWSSSNSSVATVNNGVITGHRAGSATISASFTDSDGITSTANAIGQIEKSPNCKKIAITCGIVELGKETKEINFKVGEVLAKNFNQVIAIGVNSVTLVDGVQSVGGNALTLNDIESAKSYLSGILKSGDIVAFFNDLPDVYGI